jgi:hypothetical protein
MLSPFNSEWYTAYKKQVIQLLDAFVEHGPFKRKVKSRAA